MARPEFKTEWEEKHYDEAFDAMQKLLNLANAMGSSKAITAGMLDGFLSEHRTLQQAGVRNFAAFLQEWAKGDEGMMTDARNHDAFSFAKEVVELDPMFACI